MTSDVLVSEFNTQRMGLANNQSLMAPHARYILSTYLCTSVQKLEPTGSGSSESVKELSSLLECNAGLERCACTAADVISPTSDATAHLGVL
jgi:hypothetical protein